MIGFHRLRRYAPLGVAAVLALALAACAQSHPNTTFTPHSDLGRSIDFLWNRLMLFGTIVFILVEGALVYVVIRYRRRNEDVVPPQTHGHVLLEITWTLIPAAILAFIAVPTVRTIFETQAPAPANSLVIEVYGHQWWWEFRYPEYKFTTANEIYVPKGRTVDLVLRSQDVIHSFWVPQLAGKRDAIPNHTNHIWFTPDSNMATTVWNGFCTEYCGDSHGEMHFRVVTVDPDQFRSWVTRQQAPAFFNEAATPVASAPQPAAAPAALSEAVGKAAVTTTQSTNTPAEAPTTPAIPATPTATPAQLAAYILPRSEIPEYAIPHTPLPEAIKFDDRLKGDPAAGEKLFVGAGTCNACHTVVGNPLAVGTIGPNLTHVGSRIAFAGDMYVNDKQHLSRWIKNARLMKSGVLMPTLGKGQYDPQTKATTPSGLSDQQVADLVAYLQALK
jgi:cytochrome c oxidase subunit II